MRLIGIVLFLLLLLPAHGQYWRAVGSGLDGDVRTLYGDTISGKLFAGGSFWSSGAVIVKGISAWDHSGWDSLGGGTTQCSSPGCNPVTTVVKYNNELYVGGMFYGMQNTSTTTGIAKWNGASWQSVGGTDGSVFDLVEFNNNLYAVGIFDSIGGIAAYSIARYDGITWYPVADTIFRNRSLSCATVYQNELYVSGTFQLTAQGFHCIARYDEATWSSVGVGSFFGGACGINTMEVFQNALVVGGYFSPSIGGPAEGIAQWNGSTWSDVGGGLTDTLGFPSNVFDFCIYDNKLVAGGAFCYAGGVHASNLAQWNGNTWCSFGSQFSSGITALESFDDTLYVGGGFWSIDSDTSFQYVAQWIGGSFVDTCGNTSTIKDVGNILTIKHFPNPADASLTFQFSSSIQKTILLYDSFGRLIHTEQTSSSQHILNVESFAEGIYFYTIVEDGEVKANGRIVVVH